MNGRLLESPIDPARALLTEPDPKTWGPKSSTRLHLGSSGKSLVSSYLSSNRTNNAKRKTDNINAADCDQTIPTEAKSSKLAG